MEFKVTKEEIRDIARKLGLSVADKPSMACLSSRFPYGQTITADALRRVGDAENYLHARGFNVVRVRDHAGIARIEIMPAEMVRFMEMRDAVSAEFKRLGFSYVTLDLMGFGAVAWMRCCDYVAEAKECFSIASKNQRFLIKENYLV